MVQNLWFCQSIREVPVPVWIHREAAKSHGWSEFAWEIRHRLHKYGRASDTRKQRSLEVRYRITLLSFVTESGDVLLTFCLSSFGSKELREGGKILVEKIKKFKPLIAVFNGKCKFLTTNKYVKNTTDSQRAFNNYFGFRYLWNVL